MGSKCIQVTEGLQGRRAWHIAELQGPQQGTERITGQQPLKVAGTGDDAPNAGVTLDAGMHGCITVQQQTWLAAIAAKQGLKE